MVTLVNRAKMSTSTTGTGTITLGSAETGYQSFADAGVADGDVVRYVIEDGDDWEIGSGTYTATGTTLTRTVDESSNSDAALNLTGSAVVFITAAAEDVFQGELYSESYDGTSTKPTASGTNTIAIGVNAYTVNENSIAIGNNASAQGGTSAVALGDGADARQVAAVAIGFNSYTNGAASVALGRDAVSYTNGYATSISRSYSSGADSFAAAIANNSASYGASYNNSIAMGSAAKAAQGHAVAIGRNTVVTGGYGLAIGGRYGSSTASYSSCIGGIFASSSGDYAAVLGGRSNTASGDYSTVFAGQSSTAASTYGVASGYSSQTASIASYSWAIGHSAYANVKGKYAYSGANSGFGSGGSQAGTFILKEDTTDATATTLVTEIDAFGADAENQIILPNESAFAFTGTVVCREDATDGDDYAGWEVKGVIMRQGAAADTTLGVGIVNKLYSTSGISAADVALSADTTNGGLKVEVTGVASTNLRWVASIQTSEVVNA